ncbi:non-ribosomal peptide synthetase, partial [Streptomyces scopuliridis]
AFAHQDVPFERVVEAVNPTRSLARHPLFQTMLMWNNTPTGDGSAPPLGDIEARALPAPAGGAKVDLTFVLTEQRANADQPAGLAGALEYAADLFEPATAERFAHWFIRLLDQAVADPDARIADLDLTTEEEARSLISRGSAHPAPLPEGTFVDRITDTVCRVPNAVAVTAGGVDLTYVELDAAADDLTRRLRERGVGAGSLVAVSLPRTVELVVALLAILRAGAAYVPLDPDHPADRLAFVLADAAPALLLTDRAGDPSAGRDVPRLYVDETPSPGRLADDHRVSVPGTAAAYTIYTSGSTGRPKGVVVPRDAVTNFLHSMAERHAVAEGDRLVAVTTVGFDISVLELFLPLVTGATVVLADRDTVREPARLASLVAAERDRATTLLMQATPGLWRELLDSAPEALRDVRALVGGEALPPDLADALAAHTASVHNMYGPTETTVWSTTAPVSVGGAPDIGAPIGNTSVFVLDAGLRPVPVGVPGELYVGGAGLARSYHQRPALTAGRFVANPYGPPGSRLYRTGDLARWNGHGTLDYLGRVDDQVKVRGFRIELGEVESVLLTHPDVHRAVVTVREDTPGDRRLVGYVVAGTDGATLRRFLGESLPDYMVPSVVMAIDTVPLTPSGKVDRGALPAPVHAAGAGRTPRDPREEALCALFAEVLGVERICIDDDFFDLGGHSMLAARIVDRIRERLGMEITVRAVFGHPTVARLAAHLDDGSSAAAAARPALRKRSAQ